MQTLEDIINDNYRKAKKEMWSVKRQQAELCLDIAIHMDYESEIKSEALTAPLVFISASKT